MTTRGRLAVAAMTDVALREQFGPVTLTAISARQLVSKSYLELLFAVLRRHGLVESTRGPGGGYSLSRAAGSISVADIVVAVDGPVDRAAADRRARSPDNGRVAIDDLWSGLYDTMLAHMSVISLKQLASEQLARGVSVEAPQIQRSAIYPRNAATTPVATGPSSVFAWGSYC